MIGLYVNEALHTARYEIVDDGTFYAEVPRLRGVMAIGDTLEECREQLAEVVEEWVLVRVAMGLPVPRIGHVGVRVAASSVALPPRSTAARRTSAG